MIALEKESLNLIDDLNDQNLCIHNRMSGTQKMDYGGIYLQIQFSVLTVYTAISYKYVSNKTSAGYEVTTTERLTLSSNQKIQILVLCFPKNDHMKEGFFRTDCFIVK